MGTGNSKKLKEEEKQKKETKEIKIKKEVKFGKEENNKKYNDIDETNMVRMNRRQKTTVPTSLKSDLQPMQRYEHRQKTIIVQNKINIGDNQIEQEIKELHNKNFRKSSEKYLMQFKQKYQSGENNAFLTHLTEKVSHSNELTQEEIEIIRKK